MSRIHLELNHLSQCNCTLRSCFNANVLIFSLGLDKYLCFWWRRKGTSRRNVLHNKSWRTFYLHNILYGVHSSWNICYKTPLALLLAQKTVFLFVKWNNPKRNVNLRKKKSVEGKKKLPVLRFSFFWFVLHTIIAPHLSSIARLF